MAGETYAVPSVADLVRDTVVATAAAFEAGEAPAFELSAGPVQGTAAKAAGPSTSFGLPVSPVFAAASPSGFLGGVGGGGQAGPRPATPPLVDAAVPVPPAGVLFATGIAATALGRRRRIATGRCSVHGGGASC
ncbi:hypothetical protein [Parvularcula dongshanensis]|uniref:Uncharacterized protein n=1 Tax=Parvularcula dongshanensis TaxID=1173995 RepID=A0A840I4X5_9PROT|nr:hypothetical protein [Parvularcula dongshanensis]MBB4659837.1 hypothetical protein [Parvularcula dongshanensis]